MVKKCVWVFFLFMFVLGCSSDDTVSSGEVKLWPEIKPYRTGYLKVSDIHELYYELSGNPEGKPVFGLHGGPGAGSSPYMRRFFNPQKFLIVLYDQRGAGKSRPYAEIRQNTTQDLVADIEKLRRHLKLGKIILFGGSWGTTLALAYGETYPENVSGFVLRGVFTATKEETDHFYHGGVKKFFPETYDKFLSSLPPAEAGFLPAHLLSLIQTDDAAQKAKYCRVWAEYEVKLSSLYFPDEAMNRVLNEFDPLAFGLLENYYMANRCFLEEGQLLREADKLRDIPMVIVNGRYDMICPPITAYRLHQRLPHSQLIIAEQAGHWMGDRPIEQALLKAIRDFE
jgi:proline iminopeptidase